MNWHVTRSSSGSRSVGATTDRPGHYTGDEYHQRSIVAPGEFVEQYLLLSKNDYTDDAIAEAVDAWASERYRSSLRAASAAADLAVAEFPRRGSRYAAPEVEDARDRAEEHARRLRDFIDAL